MRWFGYKLHLIVDSRYELPVGFELTKASESDSTKLPGLVADLAERQPVVVERAEEMAYCGFEKDRESQKWRCPARAFGFECAGRASCESPSQIGEYGRVVRVPLSLNRRSFTPVSRVTQKWEKAYDRRTAVERINSRIDRVLSFEVHTIRGLSKMRMRVTLALCIMLAMALGRIEADQREKIRSRLAPTKKAA